MRVWLLMTLFAGCSGSQAALDPHEAAVVVARCQHYARCGSISASQVASCETALAAQFMSLNQVYSPDEALAAGLISYDAKGAADCVASISSAGCDLLSEQSLGQGSACRGFIHGLVPAGGNCKSSSECQNGYCDAPQDGCAGNCMPFTATGDGCGGQGPCAATDFCSSKGTYWVCTPLGGAGGTCIDASACTDSLVCQGGKCQNPGGAGAACMLGIIGENCGLGLFCDPASVTCKARLPAGSSCTSSDQCTDGLRCATTCQSIADIGGSCASALCADDAVCDPATQRCTLFGQLGADCPPKCGLGLYCNSASKCAQQVAFGGNCDGTEFDPCVGGDCVNGTCGLLCSL